MRGRAVSGSRPGDAQGANRRCGEPELAAAARLLDLLKHVRVVEQVARAQVDVDQPPAARLLTWRPNDGTERALSRELWPRGEHVSESTRGGTRAGLEPL